MTSLDEKYVESVIRQALAEDVGNGDITSMLTIDRESESEGRIVAKEPGVLAGQVVVGDTFFYASWVGYEDVLEDGAELEPGAVIGTVSGSTGGILKAERVALNFLQRMCGIATLTRKYVSAVEGTSARIVDTRKTTPGLRRLEKYAVTVGGGSNHRFGLYDGILIKDNHIIAAGSVGAAVCSAREGAPHTLKIEVEVTSLNQLEEALTAGADSVLLDNMPVEDMREAVELACGRVLLEASGGVNLDNVAEIAQTGVDLISVGALTHSAPALDISLELDPPRSPEQ